MHRPSLITLIALTTACSGGADRPPATAVAPAPAVFEYQTSFDTYVVSSHRNIRQNIQGMSQETQTELSFQISTQLIPDTAGLKASFVIDIVLAADLPGVSDADVARVQGSLFEGSLKSNGEIADIRAMDSNSPLYRVVTNAVKQFFPRIPIDGIRGGMTWTDTSETAGNNGAADITTSAVTLYEASGWATEGGREQMTVNWSASYTYTGAGEQLGQAFTIQGKGRRSGVYWLAADGSYVGSTSADSSTADVVVTGLGITVPIQQTGADTVKLVQ